MQRIDYEKHAEAIHAFLEKEGWNPQSFIETARMEGYEIDCSSVLVRRSVEVFEFGKATALTGRQWYECICLMRHYKPKSLREAGRLMQSRGKPTSMSIVVEACKASELPPLPESHISYFLSDLAFGDASILEQVSEIR